MHQEQRPTIRRLTVRTATARDLPSLHAIARHAVEELLADHYYTPAQVRALEEAKVHEVEADLVDEGTYYVAEVDGEVVAGSGWSPTGTLGTTSSLTVESGTAAMRASYVDPRWARRGIATLLARVTETAATLSGFRRFESMCTPMSAALRKTLGYEFVRDEHLQLGDCTFKLAVMRKQLA